MKRGARRGAGAWERAACSARSGLHGGVGLARSSTVRVRCTVGLGKIWLRELIQGVIASPAAR
jgi:hypothetical protein